MGEFIRDRIGWEKYLKPFMYKELPSTTGWSATLGSLCVLLFAVEAVTGMFLAMYYNPAPDLAYASINYIMNDVPMGRILRGIHHWGAGAMVMIVFIHLMHSFFSGSFKTPREITWVVGVLLFLITLGLGFTGYLLPWDQKAYWATVVSASIPSEIPVIGDFITQLVLAGDSVSGLTLTRFYSMHMLILPTLLVLLIAFHIYLVRLHGMSEHSLPESSAEKSLISSKKRIYRFYPEHLFRASIAFVIIFSIILLFSVFGNVPLEEKVGTIDPAYLPRPEWYYMWLFQMLTYFSGATEVIGSLVIPIGGIILLFCMPWINRNSLKGLADRPLATAVGVVGVVGIVYLTLMGFAGAQPYGEVVAIPDRQLTASELKGLRLFADLDCAYCHNIKGVGGKVVGPDLANILKKGRDREWLMTYIENPQAKNRWNIMPKYALDQESLKGLADFTLALDFEAHEMKTISREQALLGKLN
jgi:ubiquinol-cytochrome c reductase cytochrome b subunit